MDFSIKTTLSTIGLLFFIQLPAEGSQVFYAPSLCPPDQLTLQVINKTASPQRLWTQVRFDGEIDEQSFDLEAKAELKIRGSAFLPNERGFSLKTWDQNTLQVRLSCEDSISTPLSDLTSPEVTHWLPSRIRTIKLHVLNLFLKSNPVKLKAFNKMGALIAEKSLHLQNYYDTENTKWTLSEEVFRVEVQGQERLHSVLTYEQDMLEKPSPALAMSPVQLKTDKEQTYFLISTKEARPEEGFVIALNRPDLIATAREQIAKPELEKIVVAGIELGHGGFNRAFMARDKSPYSWSVNRVDAFADFAYIDCDGSPNITEERLMQKLNEGGRICFWRYRVVRELSPEEVATGRLKP